MIGIYLLKEGLTMLERIKNPTSALTHMVGACLSIVGLVLLVYRAAVDATVWHIVSFAIFGSSLIILYMASTTYHTFIVTQKWTTILRKIDHMMIYVLIAGTYTPICLVALRGPLGWSLFGSILVFLAAGIIMKVFWLSAPRWLSTIIYVIMGWLVVVAIYPLFLKMPVEGIYWLAAGGISYSVGAVIYGLKWPSINKRLFNFHDIFHLFVLGGSLCHFWLMYRYVLYLP